MEEIPLAPFDLYTADECFLTGSGAELIPVKQIGKTCLPKEKPVFLTLQAAFRDRVAGTSRFIFVL